MIVDNAPAHSKTEFMISGDIRIYFLPPNVTALSQPLDQDIIECLKRHYRLKLTTNIVTNVDEDDDIHQCLRDINLKDVICWLASAWDEVSPNTIRNCWKKIWPQILTIDLDSHEEDSIISDTKFYNLLKTAGIDYLDGNNLHKWLIGEDSSWTHLTDEDILNMVQNSDETSTTICEDYQDSDSESNISSQQAKFMLQKLHKWAELNLKINKASLLNLNKLIELSRR